MPRTRNTAPVKKTCDGTGKKWLVVDGCAVCPGCEMSPGAIGADKPKKVGRNFTGVVPEHFITPTRAATVAAKTTPAPAPKAAPARSTKVTANEPRYTVVPGDNDRYYVHDQESGDIVGLGSGYNSQERAERKIAELLKAGKPTPATPVTPPVATVTPIRGARTARSTATTTADRKAATAAKAKATAAPKATTARVKAASAPARPAQTPKAAANGDVKAAKASAKRELAVAALTAVADMFESLPDDDPIFAGMSHGEAQMCLSNWMHHWPVGDTWPSETLPVPDRSNWR
jgi:hypothetical protein